MHHKAQQLRIIAGKWKSRKISFLALPGVRPTTDANRETLFNWLQHEIQNATCLDLFAGSGALGFEALSRGARHVTMIDASLKIIRKLQENARLLATNDLTCIYANLPRQFNKIPSQVFDIIFLDPPFQHNLIAPCCDILENNGYIAINSYIYIEAERDLAIATIIPKSWRIEREKLAGQVRYCLCKKHSNFKF